MKKFYNLRAWLFRVMRVSVQGVSKKRGPFFKIDIIPLFIMESFQNFVCL